MAAAPDNGGGLRRYLSWPIIFELVIAPPATAGIVAVLTWWVYPSLEENMHPAATASALTPLGLLSYLVLQAVGLARSPGLDRSQWSAQPAERAN